MIDREAGGAERDAITCLCVVTFLDEERYLPQFLASIGQQQRRPDRLLLVDDGSTDQSLSIARDFALRRSWVDVRERPKRPPSKDRLRGAPELVAFAWAIDEAGGDEEVIVKMDADLELAPEHFSTVLAAFADDEQLGMAGTYLWARKPDGTAYREEHPAHHVRGPTRFYRRRCWQAITPLPAILGWDGADEVRARAGGWKTRSMEMTGQRSYHLRPTGQHDGRLRAFARWGECAYAVGAHPVGVAAAAVLRAGQRPRVLGAGAYLLGWAASPARGVPRFPDDIRRATREEQRRRLRVGRRSLETR